MSKNVFVEAEKIRELMAKNDLSEDGLAAAVGVSVIVVRKWLRGEQKEMKVLSLIKLAHVLKVPLKELVAEEKE